MKLSFHKKILISFIVLFSLLILFLYLASPFLIRLIQKRSLASHNQELIYHLQKEPSLPDLIENLKRTQERLFFKVILISQNSQKILYNSLLPGGSENVILALPEVQQAFLSKTGYAVRYTPYYSQEMAYVALPFYFQNERYILLSGYPYGQVSSLTKEFALTLLVLNALLLFIFALTVWFIIQYLTQPVRTILQGIKPFQRGLQEHIPEIRLNQNRGNDEFSQLANTLNALSKRIQTQINTLTQERNERAAILESLMEGVIAVDADQRITYINHMAKVLLELEKEHILGHSTKILKRPQCEILLEEAQKKGVPVPLTIKKENRKYLDLIAVPRGHNGAVLVLQDTTSLHKVIELGKDFIANASHELKTPITIIRGFAETLHDHPELSPEVTKEITEKIVSNCQRMDTLVKNLLTLAAIDEGLPRSRLQECDLADLIEEAIQTTLVVHPHASIHLEADQNESFLLMLDGDLVRQAILNLLDNAAKYSKPPARVTVRLKRNPHEILVQVADQGIGIPQEDLDRIFERFYAVDKSHSRSMGGSGLGLSIVERIVEKHQGKIDVESTVGVGTTFSLIFPIHDEDRY